MRFKYILLASCAFGCIVANRPALAQNEAVSPTQASLQSPAPRVSASRPDSSAEEPAPDDIIVTARKRQESILKVPVVETVLPAAVLERYQVTDLVSLSSKVPGLVIGKAVLAIGTQVSIRGVGTSSLDSGVDQSVSLNIDGQQFSQGLAYTVGTFDLAQAEVLKGPQALFFGKSSPGGVISLRTADPGPEFELVGRMSYEAYSNEVRPELIVSGPVTDTLGLRLAGVYSHDNGYFRNVAVAAPGYGGVTPTYRDMPTESYIVRGTAVWKPSPIFNARLKLNLAHDSIKGNGGEGQYTSCPDGAGRNPILGIPFLGSDENCKTDRNTVYTWMNPANFPGIRNNGVPFTRETQKFGVLEMNLLPTPAITVTSVSTYYDLVQDSLINGVQATEAGTTLSADNHFTRHEFTQELRANSDYRGPINFTVGGFYQTARVRNRIDVIGNSALGLPAALVLGTHRLDIESISAFGQLRWRIVPTLELSGGVRFTHETRSDLVFNLASGTPLQLSLPTPKISSSNYSPELTLTYTPTDDLTVFGSLKQAYKSGSYTLTVIPAPGVDNSFGDEKVQGGEIGVKGRALDRRLTANLAGYYYHYTGLQVGTGNPAENGVPIVRTLNAGSANVYGVDFDAAYRPPSIEGLNLRGSINWNHARFKKLINAPCYGGQTIAQGCTLLPNPQTGANTAQDLSGGALTRAPKWQVGFGFDYDLALSHGAKLTFSSDNRYSSRYLTDLLARSDFYQRKYFETDASVTLTSKSGLWEVSVIGDNLTNQFTTGNCTHLNGEGGQIFGGQNTGTNLPAGPAGVDELYCQINRGREVWLRLTIRPFNH